MPIVKSGLIAVTGASGFIGAHIVLALLRENYSVRAIVRDATNNVKTEFLTRHATKIGAQNRLEFASGDLLKEGSYDDAIRGCVGVVHVAAVVELGDTKDGQKKIVDPSVKGIHNVMGAVEKSGSVLRFVHTSSVAAVMRVNEKYDFNFSDSDWNTYSTVENGDAYGYAKMYAEKLMWELSKGKSWDSVAINPSVVLGECLCKAHTKATPVLLRQALYNASVNSFMANFVHVLDVAQAHVEALRRPDATGHRFILNNSDQEPMMLHELGPVVAELYPQYQISLSNRISPPLWFALSWLSIIPLVGGYIMSPAQRMSVEKRFYFDNKKTKELLGIPFRDLDSMIRDSVDSLIDLGIKTTKAKL